MKRVLFLFFIAVITLGTCSARRSPRIEQGEIVTETYTYTGGVTNGKQNGFGICRYNNGNVYTGYWDMGYKEGLGRMEYADSTMEFGRWHRGRLNIPANSNFRHGETVYGIDVSKYQKRIKWEQLALPASTRGKLTKAGRHLQPVLFVIVKSTQGTTIRNQYFTEQFEGAKEHNIIRGAYHFLTHNSSGAAQAQFFIENTPLVTGDMPPVLDFEVHRRHMNREGSRIINIAKEWLRIVEEHYGVKPIIYTSDNYYRDFLRSHGFEDYDFWIANYNNAPEHIDGSIWQLAQDGKAFGIGHKVDLNRFEGGDYNAFKTYVAEKGIQQQITE